MSYWRRISLAKYKNIFSSKCYEKCRKTKKYESFSVSEAKKECHLSKARRDEVNRKLYVEKESFVWFTIGLLLFKFKEIFWPDIQVHWLCSVWIQHSVIICGVSVAENKYFSKMSTFPILIFFKMSIRFNNSFPLVKCMIKFFKLSGSWHMIKAVYSLNFYCFVVIIIYCNKFKEIFVSVYLSCST